MADNDFVLSRSFDAPRELVFAAWTQVDHLLKWFGPKGTSLIAGISADFRPGGTFHYGMRGPDGKAMWGKWVIRELKAPERIVLVSSFSDEKGGITRHPMAPTWPLETLSDTTFAAEGPKKTKLTLRWSPLNATDEERAIFMASFKGMEAGWGGTMEQLDAYLAQAQSTKKGA
jgi:uncharacterized protein YndB with AHSA1/START domain